MLMLTNGGEYAIDFDGVQHLFLARCDVLVQQPAHPLRTAKLQPGVTLGLGVWAP